MDDLKNLHEILNDSCFADIMLESSADYCQEGRPKRERPVAMQSFQVDEELKKTMDTICRANGATASSFLRECSKRLVSDYLGIEIGSKKWNEKFGKGLI